MLIWYYLIRTQTKMGWETLLGHEKMANINKYIFTIGHSNHTMETFLRMLKQYDIEVMVDVRSQPHSKNVPHFDLHILKATLTRSRIKYLYLGKELGGRPDGDEFYDPDGHVLYFRLAKSELFLKGIYRLEKGLQKYRVAIMCSEEDPTSCHRRLLIGRVLAEKGFSLNHIRGDGRLQMEEDLTKQESHCPQNEGQLGLFSKGEEIVWRSIRSVSHRRLRPSSSER